LVHLLYFCLFYLSPLTVISIGSKILYSFVYRKHINHIHLHFLQFFLLCQVRVYCVIYKSSYNLSNISYLISSAQSSSFIPCSWNSFDISHFSIYIHVYTVFAPYSPLHALSKNFPPSHWCHPFLTGPVLAFCSLIL
jgi:hypothetical protein